MASADEKSKAFMGFVGGIGVAILALLISYLVQQSHNDQTQKELLSEQTQIIENLQKQIEADKMAEYPDYLAATTSEKSITPIKNLTSFVKKGTTDIVGTTEVKLKREGRVSRGYLIAKASVDGEKSLTIYDSIYVKLNYVGGHLFRPKSLKTPSSSSGTILLYPLTSISYLPEIPYDENRKPSAVNWLNIINGRQENVLLTFLSTARNGGVITEITIAYECEKETPNCSIFVTE